MTARFVAVAGLPRAGSTLLCQLLSLHPEVHCDGHSSPVCTALITLRRTLSSDEYTLAQLDAQFDRSYANLRRAMAGFLRGWHADTGRQVVVDKNRAWLRCVDLLLELAPEAKLIVPIRELGQVYGSIEAQHQKTVLLDFPDPLADLDRLGRADQLFGPDRVVGAALTSIRAVQDLPQPVRDRLYFVKFEDLMRDPGTTMDGVLGWLDLTPHAFDWTALPVRPHESDSYYRFKFPHAQASRLTPPRTHAVPPRIQAQIEKACTWYYDWFYRQEGLP